jgi:hypothetical protein
MHDLVSGRRALPLLAAALILAACNRTPPVHAPAAAGATPAASVSPAPTPAPKPLKLEIPVLAVMLGTMNEASFVIFQAGTSDKTLTNDTWRRVTTAAITLVGDASLITLPGTGPSDQQWVASPEWIGFSAEMQSASLAVGKAAVRMDRAALTEATARLAQACQSCHARFSGRLLTTPPS